MLYAATSPDTGPGGCYGPREGLVEPDKPGPSPRQRAEARPLTGVPVPALAVILRPKHPRSGLRGAGVREIWHGIRRYRGSR